ncbi:hypothetical protein F4804DRAFT_298326 [Jackrogersella minutella]|nr:hypothetical protein F4804DRAFT_298326 [Jackrogersella minutella]
MSTSSELAVQPAPPGLSGLCRILNLPPELVLDILSFLDPASVILFSLACKSAFGLVRGTDHGRICLSSVQGDLVAHRILFADYAEPTSLQRLEFLQLLAVDYLDLFVCHHCAKLHPNPTGESRNAQHNSVMARDRHDLSPKGVMTFGPLWPQHAISIDEARESLKHGTKGPGASLSIPNLTISTDWKLARLWSSCYNPDFIHGYVKLDTEAVVVDGSLFLHKAQRVLLLPEKVKSFFKARRSLLMEQVFKSCFHGGQFRYAFHPSLHSFSWDNLDKSSVHRLISELISMAGWKVCLAQPVGPDGWDLGKIEFQPHAIAGCHGCTTDNILNIHNHGRAGVEIVTDVYQNLGDVSDPTDRHWEACWTNRQDGQYKTLMHRRLDHPTVDPRIFLTSPGTSARNHPSAPSIRDVWELHEHERKVRLSQP